MSFSRAIWVEISKSALESNVKNVRARARGQDIIAVVKANAYGHGLGGIAKVLNGFGVKEFGVASLGEGLEIRQAGITSKDAKVLILGYSQPSHAIEVVESGLCQTVISSHEIRALAGASEKLGKPAHVQIKIDTGMHRLGVPPGDFPRLLEALDSFPNVCLEGIYTHYSSADEADNDFTREQFKIFKKTITKYSPRVKVAYHAANSSAMINFPRLKLDKVRVGIALYGEYASPDVPKRLNLTPALSLKSRIAEVKSIHFGDGAGYNHRFVNSSRSSVRVGIIPVGYADGFMTASSGRREVLVRGRRCLVVGAVSMDFTHIMLPDDLSIGAGEPVTLLGGDLKDRITAEELAGLFDTHVYEILCLIPTRIPRTYID